MDRCKLMKEEAGGNVGFLETATVDKHTEEERLGCWGESDHGRLKVRMGE